MILKNLSWWLEYPTFFASRQIFLSQKSYFVCLNYSCFVIRRLNQLIWSQQLIKHELLTANEYSFGAFMHPRQAGRLPLYLRPGCGGGLSVGCCRARVKAGQIESFSTMECSITMQEATHNLNRQSQQSWFASNGILMTKRNLIWKRIKNDNCTQLLKITSMYLSKNSKFK